MKKFTFLAFTVFFILILGNYSFAQTRPTSSISPTGQRLHCATMEALELYFQQNPDARALAEQNQNRFAPESQRTNRTNVIVTIPIVFHIVGSAARVAQVTDADVIWQLNKLNEDFEGANADSTNAPLFQSIRSHRGYNQIRFCLAQRDPNNNPATGITRTVSSLTGTAICNNTNIIKHTSTGGIDAWDPTRFFNVWVGEAGNCLLGIAQFPGTGNANEFGVLLAYEGFSNNPAYVDPSFNLGRTLQHEIGHCFGLYHIWGDESGCTNSDFRQLALPTTCPLLPASLAGTQTDQTVGDTPNQAGATGGCPSGLQTDACSGASPGFNYQNYMDYTNDACYSMFTKRQVDRMQYVLDNCLASLKTSNGCVPPVLTLNNAGISAVVTPPTGFVTCDPTIPLTVTLRNGGSNALTTVTITVTRNGTPVQTFNWSGNLASLATVNVPLNAVPLVLGANTIQVCTSNPNGVADSDPANDCSSVTGTRGAGTALPLVEGFEGATFPPVGWIRNNPDGGITWQRTTTGVAHTGTGKAYVDHFGYAAAGNTDDIRTPPFAIGTADSLWVSFWGAYRGFPGFPFDLFQVMVSTDCGQSFQVVYNARNDTAFVAPDGAVPTVGAGYFPGNIDQWKRKSIDLSGYIPAGNIMVQFRAINQFGNNMHLDDINIDKKIFPNNDAGVIAINKPAGRICTSSEAPVVVIKNYGKINLTSVRINYQIDGTGPVTTLNWTGNLARNQTATVTLATANLGAVGNHTINVFTTLPNNVTDEDPSNDALAKPYNVSQIFALPGTVSEEFTSNTFPPPNWSIINPNADMTWTRNGTIGRKNPGSAYFNDFANTAIDRYDDLALPNYSYSGIDSIFLTFNLAHITKTLPGTTGSRLDTLTVLLSRDCGNTFTTVYKKYGEELQTVNDPNFQISMTNFAPLASQWRRDSLNLGQWLGATEPLFQIMFRFSGNMENNFYLDDVNIRSQILPAKLKNDGYLILPNPFRHSFGVWHYQVPTNLRYVNVYNSIGQLVYSKKFPSGGDKYFMVDLGGRAAGTYTVNLGYEDSNRNVSVQVVKY